MLQPELFNTASKVALFQIGLDLNSIGSFMLETAVIKRMRRCGLEASEYALRLQNSLNEQQALCQLLLVSESWFEREREPLDLALKYLTSKTSSIRVLSVPCARGEEPISILSIALDACVPISNVKIDGYDASNSAIEQAKLFSFGEYSFRGTSDRFRTEHFKKHGPRFILNPNLREAFQFKQANIVDPNWLPRQEKYDLIVCRNMLIYLEQSLQKQLLEKLHTLLEDHGLLVLGSAEAALANLVELDRYDISTSIFKKRIKSPLTATINTESRNKYISQHKRVKFLTCQRNLKSISENNNKPGNLNASSNGTISQQSFDLANEGKLEQAFDKALEIIEKNPGDSNNYYLLGLISSSAGKIEEAKYWVSKALELNPQNEDAEIFFNSLLSSKLDK